MAVFSKGGSGCGGKTVLLDEPSGGLSAAEIAEMARDQDAFHRLYRELPVLMEQYPDQWIAMDADGIVAVADSHEGLLETLSAKGLYAGDLVIEHLNTQPEIWIL